uniref:Uncharacterized protein n=1 Tax=Arundo donax TaxID=35708 RepID=A0A0A9CBN5_ARUDO
MHMFSKSALTQFSIYYNLQTRP